MSPHFFSRSARGPPCRWWLNKDVFFVYLNSILGELGIDPIWLADVTSDGLKVETNHHVGQVVGKSGKAPHKQKALCKPQSETGRDLGWRRTWDVFWRIFRWNTCCLAGAHPEWYSTVSFIWKTWHSWKDFSKTRTNRSFTWSSQEFLVHPPPSLT